MVDKFRLQFFPAILKRSSQQTDIFIYCDDSGVIWSNSPSTTFWSDHPTHATIRISTGRGRGITIQICFNKKEKPLQSVNQNSLVIKSGCWKSQHVSPQMHRVGEYKSRMQKPNSSPPSFSSLLSSSSVWNRESSWMQQGVGCGSFFTTQMWVVFFFLHIFSACCL